MLLPQIWDNLHDRNTDIIFEVNTSFESRPWIEVMRSLTPYADDPPVLENRKHVSSQYLVEGSSLSESASQMETSKFFDDTNDAVDSVDGHTSGNLPESAMFEIDKINSNPAMISILKLIDHIMTLAWDKNVTLNSPLPKWMSSLRDKLGGGLPTSLKCKLFIAKVILNRTGTNPRVSI